MRCGPNRVTSALGRLAWTVALCGSAAGPALACEPPDMADGPGVIGRVATSDHALALRSVPAPLPLNRPFALEIALCAQNGTAMAGLPKVDAWMPAHRHGMNYRPAVTSLGPGRFRAEGMLFHMPGRWEVIVEIGKDRIPVPVDLR